MSEDGCLARNRPGAQTMPDLQHPAGAAYDVRVGLWSFFGRDR